MLKLLFPFVLVFPLVLSAQSEHCPCMDKQDPEDEMETFMTSLDQAINLDPTPTQSMVSFPFNTEPQEVEPAPEPETSYSEPRGGSGMYPVMNKRGRKPSRKGMKPRKKTKRYRGQCPSF